MYNFFESLKRLDKLSNTKLDEKINEKIPASFMESQPSISKFYGTLLYVEIDCKDELIKSMFFEEILLICKSGSYYRDCIVSGNSITIICNSSIKIEINDIVSDAVKINTLSGVMLKKARKSKVECPISTNIIVHYGVLTRYYSVILKKCIWGGESFDKIPELFTYCKNGFIIITRMVWTSLRDEEQKLFKLEALHSLKKEEIYSSSIINRVINNWMINN